MARFDVHQERASGVLLLDCQADALSHLTSRFVVPLLPVHDLPVIQKLNPISELNDDKVLKATNLAATVGVQEMGPLIGSVDHGHYRITGALDMLMGGF